MNTIAMHKSTDRILKLDQAQMAQDFAERICAQRVKQIAEIANFVDTGKLHSVEALYKIQAICNKVD